MAKLELDLKHAGNTVGSTEIDLNGVPQFSLKYYSARPNKIPIPMMDTLLTNLAGGLDYIGPLQPRNGFLSDNTYTVEVTVLNAPVGTIVGLSTLELTDVSPGDNDSTLPGVTIVPINGGATNQSRVAEFQVTFNTYPSIYSTFYWIAFKWLLTTPMGTFVDPTPQVLNHGGERLTNGMKRRLDEDRIYDRILEIHPGQYGFWVDIMIGGGGGGCAGWRNGKNVGSSGQAGGSVALYYADPSFVKWRHPYTYDGEASVCIPIAFAEGGQGQIVRPGDGGIVGSGVGGVSDIFEEHGRTADSDQLANVIIEAIEYRNGGSHWDIGSNNPRTNGGYIDKVVGGDTTGKTIAYAWSTMARYGSGSGSYAIMRIHMRRRASDGNLPTKPLSLRLSAKQVDDKYDREIKGTYFYSGAAGETKPPHTVLDLGAGLSEPLTRTKQLPKLPTSTKGGLGGTGYANGGYAGGVGTMGILDFGYYTSYA